MSTNQETSEVMRGELERIVADFMRLREHVWDLLQHEAVEHAHDRE